MSIAISARVRPSRLFLLLVVAMACFFAGIAIGVHTGNLGAFVPYGSEGIVAISVLMVILLAYAYLRYRKNFQVDISGTGQIRVQSADRSVQNKKENGKKENESSEEVYQIVKGSTIWPNLLFLHLQSGTGKKAVIRIFPDSVSQAEFRALYIACQWIMARQKH